MTMKKNIFAVVSIFLIYFGALNSMNLLGEQSLFAPQIAASPLVQKMFSFIENNREKIIEEWIYLTEIPSPSGGEAERAEYMKKQFEAIGLEEVNRDSTGNVIGLWKGTGGDKKIAISAHLDTVFKGISKIKVIREGDVLKAPGIGDDTASLINLIWTIRALKAAEFKPKNTYYFLATVGEEAGLIGIKTFLDSRRERFDLVIALDGDLGKISYGALGFCGGRIYFRGPGAHTMQSKGVPNPNLAVAKAVERIYGIKLPSEPLEKFTVLNIGLIGGGSVQNAVSQESFFSVDLRSADQEELEKAREKIKRICEQVAREEGVEVEMKLDENSRACQIPGARDSYLVKTVVDILSYLKVKDIEVDPLGSTEANAAIERGILALNLGRTYGKYKHSLREEAEIDGLFLAQKQILLLMCCLQ